MLHRLPYYDALIVQAAIVSGYRCVWSEDLHNGALFAGVRVDNPFA